MSALSPEWVPSPEGLRRVVAHVRTLALRDPGISVAAAARERRADATAREVMALVDAALGAGRAGKTQQATDLAFDAYIAFTPLETPARAKNPGRVVGMSGIRD